MVYESNIAEKIEAWQTEENMVVKDVRVERLNPLTISIRIVTDHQLESDEIDDIKKQIEARLGKSVELEITTSIKR